jgi:hypothetical protein
MWKWNVTFCDKDLRTRVPPEFLIGSGEGYPQKRSELIEARTLYASRFVESGGTDPEFWVRVVLNKIEWEDGSGQSWNFHGRLIHPVSRNVLIRGHYSTKTNAGHIIFETQEEAKRAELTRAIRELREDIQIQCGASSVDKFLNFYKITGLLGWGIEEYNAALKAGLI